jgi:hypothetical protein
MTPPRPRDDHAEWQRRAHLHLGQILAKHSRLQPLRWSLAPYGCGLAGELGAPSDAYSIERAFAEWTAALGLPIKSVPGRLVASGQTDGCHITITATLPKAKGRRT